MYAATEPRPTRARTPITAPATVPASVVGAGSGIELTKTCEYIYKTPSELNRQSDQLRNKEL